MKEKLLVLDDEELILASLEHLFEDQYDVFTATDAGTALPLALEHDIAVILCDERMPGVTGHEFLRRVRQVSKATRVMMSGYADMSALTEAVNSGQIFGYIAKPWEPLILKEKVAAALVHFKLVQSIDHERELLRAVMENIPDLIYFKDRDSRFIRVNQEQARTLGVGDPVECIGRTDADYFDPERAAQCRREEEEIVKSGKPQVDLIEQLSRPSGGFCWMSTTKAPMFDRSGRVTGTATISRNITLLKRAEEELQLAKESAEFANRAKSEFLTTMSHEMRTPMNAILGMADLLADSSISDEQRGYVRIFQKAGANLLHLINDILDLSKVESGHLELECICFHLSALLEKTIEMMAPRAQERGLRLTLEVPTDIPQRLYGDPHRLRQVLINLIGNALKFTEQGSVTLAVEREPGRAEGWLRFRVVDTGVGIATDKTNVIFDRFTQADSSTTRRYGGTGLGLAISKGLVELMGGEIGCTSELGSGSTFFLAAPFDVHEESESGEDAEPIAISPLVTPAQCQTGRILIAEDSEDNLALFKAYLKDCGLELDFAENGKIAFEKVVSGKPHLVLMDLQMPVMGGLESTRTIRQWESDTNARPVPILALTAHAAEEGARYSLEAGCNEHLTKPIKKATLLAAISRCLGGTIRITPPKDIESLVPKYLANVRRDIGKVLEAVDSRDCTIARRVGHQFKGSGEGYGIPEIARSGAAIELAAIASNEEEIRNQILALASYLDRVEIVA